MAAGWRKPSSAGGAITHSLRKGARCFVHSGKAGGVLLRPSAASQESSMPDFRKIVRERIATLGLTPAAESGLTEELAQHLADHYQELRSGGATEDEALQ